MVNYHNPVTIAREYAGVVKLWHVVNGIFIWEFITNLDYEWDVIRGHRPYRWTIWIYSLARVTTLMAVILNMVGFDTTTPINCQVWVTFEVFFAYLAFVASSLLIVLRVIAIWNKAKIVIAIAMGIWAIDISLFINGTIRLRSTWSPEALTCVVDNIESTKPNIVGSLFSDIALLLIMLIGLYPLRGAGAFALGRTLWKQGLIWLLFATVAEVPQAVLMILDLNVSLDLIDQTPAMIIMTIATTRVYRSLTKFYTSDIQHEVPKRSGNAASEMMFHSVPIPLTRVEVAVHTESDPYLMSQITHSDSYVGTDPQGRYKTHEVSSNTDVEKGLEK
ncbi:hypothetical protein DFH94DRAFT_25075 [Russula ochroleuca]|jgi:hypothetical protein|uniref:Uncharacterized protein n=1 Tax=Russula ochroleuca TaxID=152965 RepID=A0A9P5TEU5_9AGAM|nr:hypothetical protein DFH94DRAFT_25075 [Russula ochroleuca]